MICQVQFWRDKDNAYAGRKYAYYCAASVKPGYLVKVAVGKKNEIKVARVAEINVPENKLEDRVLAVMKHVLAVVDDGTPKGLEGGHNEA